MRRFHIYIGFIVWLLTSLFAVSCTDELEGNGYTPNSSSNLQVLVPLVHSNGTRAGESDPAENLTYNATEEECRINSLRLFAFPIDGKGTLLNEYLGAPGTSFYEPGNFEGGVDVATYTLRIDPGTYRIYVVANMEDVLKAQETIDTEDKLKKVVLNYLPEGKPGMPACGNIPMIYEPLKDTNITGDSKTTDIVANLKFTCVKVKLNLLFDPADSEMQEALKTNGLKINDITANNLSQSTSLVWGGKFYASDKEDVSGIIGPKIMYKQSSEASAAGSFFSNWTRDDTNKNKSNADVITAVGTAAAAPSKIKDKWLFQGTYYLPERYIKTNDQQSFLTLSSMIGANDNSYNIPLGHTDNPEAGSCRTFPRGTYYEIIGKIKSLGNMTLNCNVSVEDWTPVTIDADFSHTTLWVNKTSAQITSIEEDSISYKSNWVNVEFGCDAIVDGKPLVVVDKRDEVNHIITFRINPEIPMSAYGDGEGKFPPKGKTKIWLKANNLKKYLDVDYNVEPLFEVDPLEVIIYYEENAKTNTKVFTWVTNLGGIVLPDNLISIIGSSTIKISKPSDENAPKGTFQVEATTDPGTTTVHTFRVHSKDLYNSNYKYRDIKVTVRPPVDNYRIYFRAINDRSSNSSNNDKFKTNQFQGILDEYYGTGDNNNNWNDSWSWDNKMQTSRHNVYIYSQKGETTGTAIPKENVWYFNGRYNNPSGMTGDTNNPGWYYQDMDFNAKGYRLDKGDGQETTPIKPGETLMIFYSFINDGADLHRCPQHMAPGIPLFNYEDREGWILYDPTTDPYYRIFDEKPIVKDINYVVYTKKKVLGWAFKFGVATDNPTSSESNDQYVHWDNTWDGHSAKSFKSEQVGVWWKTTIRLKAVDGYHEKGIVLQFEKDVYDEKYTLFGGRSYEKYNDTGYYDNGSWHHGKPSDV
jgi:hypothetical protein